MCASMSSAHLSSPFSTTHLSRADFVVGHAQHIFFPDFPTKLLSVGAGAGQAVVVVVEEEDIRFGVRRVVVVDLAEHSSH